jgi:hypothetical protein
VQAIPSQLPADEGFGGVGIFKFENVLAYGNLNFQKLESTDNLAIQTCIFTAQATL